MLNDVEPLSRGVPIQVDFGKIVEKIDGALPDGSGLQDIGKPMNPRRWMFLKLVFFQGFAV